MPKITFLPVMHNSYYSDGFLSVGLYLCGNKAVLIDSGGDDNASKDVSAALEALDVEVAAIITTHCHPDHCGGNAFLQKKYPDVAIYATYNEKFFIEDPEQAPRCFCAGATPYAGLKNKCIAPQRPSVITDVISPYEDQELVIDGEVFRILTLPGHTQGQVGVITPDNVLYPGDALFGPETLVKHPVLLYTDIKATLATFDKLESLKVDECVLYHGGKVSDFYGLVAQHRENLLGVKVAVRDCIEKGPCSFDELTQRVMQRYAIPNSLIAFILTQTAVKAYVTHLEAKGVVALQVQDGILQIAAT